MKNTPHAEHSVQFSLEWTAALACFVVAGITGTAFRLAAAGFEPLSGLNLGYVRNAHSHLMLFSWATPPLMILMAQRLALKSTQGGAKNFRARTFRRIIRAAIMIGVLTFVPFLISGYTSTKIGPISLPLTIIFSTLGMFVWYAFSLAYWRARRGLARDSVWRLWDWANAFLCLSTLGAWARGAFIGMKVTDARLTHGSIQFFVITFSFGWLTLGMLGEFHRRRNTQPGRAADLGTALLAAGIPLIFISAQTAQIPSILSACGHLSALAVGVGLSLHLYTLRESGGIRWRNPSIIALIFVAGAMLISAVPPILNWANTTGLRLIFVHLLLLGVVTMGLLEVYPRATPIKARGLMPAAILILLATMLPTTGLWPRALYTPWTFYFVALGSTAPWLGGTWILMENYRLSAIKEARPSPEQTAR